MFTLHLGHIQQNRTEQLAAITQHSVDLTIVGLLLPFFCTVRFLLLLLKYHYRDRTENPCMVRMVDICARQSCMLAHTGAR
jgi:RsiW-degrading membrane proteinase PrsW (M82 family)